MRDYSCHILSCLGANRHKRETLTLVGMVADLLEECLAKGKDICCAGLICKRGLPVMVHLFKNHTDCIKHKVHSTLCFKREEAMLCPAVGQAVQAVVDD